ncbi:MAG TPA: glycosyltransferase family 4 protein [Solirubrobacteraceae bacterium]|nr:glycosyltransferase family 4 protein [Solirubrobacteraceae bacterium]
MRVSVVDPAAYTPPYDRALCAALARAGADVELLTAPFPHGEVPPARGFAVREDFYRYAPAGRGRRLARLATHVPDMLRASRRDADIVHFQWLAVQPLDQHLLRAFGRPRVITAHDVLPREPLPGQRDAQHKLYEQMDAIVVHTEHGRARLVDELGLDPARVHVIAHGVLRPGGDAPLPPELPAYDGAVVLCFGLLRPYKGIDVLLEAWRGIERAELWIVGAPRMDVEPLHAAAPPGVRFVQRFVSEGEAAALFRRADLAVLPYREIDQSGVLYTALGFGVPLVLTDVGGFPDVARAGAGVLVPPGDPVALHDALLALLDDPPRTATLATAALRLADDGHDWDAIARAHLELYGTLLP